MSELKLISPLLDDFDTGGSIGEHHGVSCYPAMRKNTSDRYIIKKVAIPASQTQLDALLLTGAYTSSDAALSYFEEQANSIIKELETLQRLSELEGFLSYDSWQVVSKEDAVGYDVYMLGSYKYSLRKYLQHTPATHLSAVNLGLDLCSALAACRRLGYLYVALKPNNIYVLDDNFRIGDIGFLPLDTLKYTTLPEKYFSQYTAPEAFDAFSSLTPTIDIYAVGLILYQIFNGGDLPFADRAPDDEKLPAPAYADYEIAEIILKACDPSPSERWQDPAEMAQALISYMQKNGVNASPIVPPTLSIDEFDVSDYTPDEAALEPIAKESSDVSEANEMSDELDLSGIDLNDISGVDEVDGNTQYDEDDFGNLTFLNSLVSDETSPENNLTNVAYDEISDELSEILNQADELVAHPVPDSAISIEATPVEELEADAVPTTEEEQDAFPLSDGAPLNDTDSVELVEDDAGSVPMDETIVVTSLTNDDSKATVSADNFDDRINEDEVETDTDIQSKPKSKVGNWILTVVIFVLIAAIAAVGFFYYRTIYLLPINSIKVDGNESNMVVTVDADIDESLLNVVCSDSHGNQISAAVVNGTATFANLTPDTAYNVQVIVDGFHRLTGATAASYSTPAQTNVAQFTAVTGAEDGSVILSFTLEGPDSGNWKLSYTAPNEEEQTVDVLSHMITLNGLTVGKEYTFTLIPGEEMYVTGTTQISYTASNLVFAENVLITSCTDGTLVAEWSSPENEEVSSWTVRCYNDAEYNQTTITSDNTISFEEIDPNSDYTVEVIAAGMSLGERAFMPANAITVTNFTADTQTPDVINLTWETTQPVPADGWVLLYNVDGSSAQGTVLCTENAAQITPAIPSATYTFKLQQADGTPALSQNLTCQTPDPQDFSGYGMTRGTMTFQLCKRPEGETWTRYDLSDADYTTTFTSGTKIAIIGQLDGRYGISDDSITALFVVRDLEGNLVTYSSTTRTWNDMWEQSYAEFDIPQIPGDAGDYTVTVYFNGKFVTQKAFTIN